MASWAQRRCGCSKRLCRGAPDRRSLQLGSASKTYALNGSSLPLINNPVLLDDCAGRQSLVCLCADQDAAAGARLSRREPVLTASPTKALPRRVQVEIPEALVAPFATSGEANDQVGADDQAMPLPPTRVPFALAGERDADHRLGQQQEARDRGRRQQLSTVA